MRPSQFEEDFDELSESSTKSIAKDPSVLHSIRKHPAQGYCLREKCQKRGNYHVMSLACEFLITRINNTSLRARRRIRWTVGPFTWAVFASVARQARPVVVVADIHAFGGSTDARRLLDEIVMM